MNKRRNESMLKLDQHLAVRDAVEADIAALTEIKGAGTETVHIRRLNEVRARNSLYLVLLLEEEPIGFCRLVLDDPGHDASTDDSPYLPSVDDLEIKEFLRGRGYGTNFLSAIEQIVKGSGFRKIYLQVEPLGNPRAYALYQRLGYQAIQTQPYCQIWEFVDSTGKIQSGEEWVIDMVKQLE
jgi:GNAT superfamily N-acetyltransferase